MFIIGRVVAGVGSAGVANGAMTTISAVLPVQKQALFMGFNMGAGQLGLATGPIIGGAFTTNVSWRWCMLLYFLRSKPQKVLELESNVPYVRLLHQPPSGRYRRRVSPLQHNPRTET
jgi:MFS family permease